MRQHSARRSIGALAAMAALLLGLGALAQAETVRQGGLQVRFEGKLAPQALPRSGQAPVSVSVSAKVVALGAAAPPPLRQIAIEINRHGHLDTTGLPVCQLEQIQPATTDDALAACRGSLVGEGRFLADVSGHAPFPADGKIYAFNGELDGRPAILAHVYGTKPGPASFTLAFLISRKAKGTFGTTLKAKLPSVDPSAGSITAIYLSLGKTFSVAGKRRSYLSASCPAPKGLPGASFVFARVSLGFQNGPTLGTALNRSCKTRD
jgi:hypothetical protein